MSSTPESQLASSDGGVCQFHLLRFNEQQDFLFVRVNMDKRQDMLTAALEAAPGGVWIGEHVADDDGQVQALVFVNAMKHKGAPSREQVVSTLHRATSKVARTLEAQLGFNDAD